MKTTVSPAIQAAPAADAAGEQALAGILREIHRMWLAEARQRVAPAMAPEADFWDGWSAVRCLMISSTGCTVGSKASSRQSSRGSIRRTF